VESVHSGSFRYYLDDLPVPRREYDLGRDLSAVPVRLRIVGVLRC
jgi:hypothetical protein